MEVKGKNKNRIHFAHKIQIQGKNIEFNFVENACATASELFFGFLVKCAVSFASKFCPVVMCIEFSLCSNCMYANEIFHSITIFRVNYLILPRLPNEIIKMNLVINSSLLRFSLKQTSNKMLSLYEKFAFDAQLKQIFLEINVTGWLCVITIFLAYIHLELNRIITAEKCEKLIARNVHDARPTTTFW